MLGLPHNLRESIGKVVEDFFDQVALDLIGNIPKLKDKKRLVITSQSNLGLPHLFVQALGNKKPNEIEQDFLKGLLDNSHGYVESLKSKTKSNILDRIDGLFREANVKKSEVRRSSVQKVIDEELSKAKSALTTIAEAESTKIRNLGTMMDISRVSSSVGDSDPTVFFVVLKDSVTCKECIKLHLMPDQVTPRLWKLSELKQGYHKRGEETPSAFGLHPHCRCFLTYLSKGFTFQDGRVSYKTEGHDEYSKQRS